MNDYLHTMTIYCFCVLFLPRVYLSKEANSVLPLKIHRSKPPVYLVV